MPPIKAPNKTNETSSKGKTNLLNKISPNNLVDVPSLITTVESNVCRRIYVNIPKIDSDITAAINLFLSLSSSAFGPKGALVIITPNKNRTITAPIYTSIRTKATNSADNNMNKTAVVARVKTKNMAACITFDAVSYTHLRAHET